MSFLHIAVTLSFFHIYEMHWLFSLCGLGITAALLGAVSMSLSVLQLMNFYFQRWQTWFFKSVSPRFRTRTCFLFCPPLSAVLSQPPPHFMEFASFPQGIKLWWKGCVLKCVQKLQPPITHCPVWNVGLSRDNFSLSFCFLSEVRAWNPPPLFFFLFCF